MQENAAAFFIKLDKEEQKYLEDAFSKDKVSASAPRPMLALMTVELQACICWMAGIAQFYSEPQV